MCFTQILLGERLGKIGFGVLLNSFAQFSENNPDGYAIRVADKVYKTLSASELLSYILDHRKLIENSQLVHLHFRNATTGGVSVENCHLWEIAGYYCAHNGTVMGQKYNNGTEVDSYIWFREHEEAIRTENIEKLAEGSFKGWGVFTLSSKQGDKVIVGSVNKPVIIQVFDSVLSLASAEVTYKPMLDIKLNKNIKLFGFQFTVPYKVFRIVLRKPRITTKTTMDDEWVLISLTEKAIIKRAEVTSPYFRKWYGNRYSHEENI